MKSLDWYHLKPPERALSREFGNCRDLKACNNSFSNIFRMLVAICRMLVTMFGKSVCICFFLCFENKFPDILAMMATGALVILPDRNIIFTSHKPKIEYPVLLFLGVFVSLVILLLWICFFECFLLTLQGC